MRNATKALWRKIKNFLFCLRYPFWKSANVFTGEFLGYDSTWYDDLLPGWRKAFGKALSRDIKRVGRKYLRAHPGKKWGDILQWQQIKEKYGWLSLYAAAIDEIQVVLDKYELLSGGYCQICGKPARYRTAGWIGYYCEDCARADENFKTRYSRLRESDAPQLFEYEDRVLRTWERDSENEAAQLIRSLRENGSSRLYRLNFSEDLKK